MHVIGLSFCFSLLTMVLLHRSDAPAGCAHRPLQLLLSLCHQGPQHDSPLLLVPAARVFCRRRRRRAPSLVLRVAHALRVLELEPGPQLDLALVALLLPQTLAPDCWPTPSCSESPHSTSGSQSPSWCWEPRRPPPTSISARALSRRRKELRRLRGRPPAQQKRALSGAIRHSHTPLLSQVASGCTEAAR